MPEDILSKFPAPTWRGIPFPLTSLENAFTHEHVEHKWLYVDGMRIEATGRNGFNFNAHIPFNNGVRAAPFEPWTGQVLFPTLFRKFLAACVDRSSGEFVHPDFGPIQCKARDVSWRYGATVRDGAELSVRFYQSSEDVEELQGLLAQQSPIAMATATAEKLDDEIAAAGPLPELANNTSSFSSMMQAYQTGTGSLGPMRSKLDNTSSALDRMDDVSFWPLRAATEDMRHSLFGLDVFAGHRSANVRTFTVLSGSSLPTIAMRLGVPTDDLVRMNPHLARNPGVPAGTTLRYPTGAP